MSGNFSPLKLSNLTRKTEMKANILHMSEPYRITQFTYRVSYSFIGANAGIHFGGGFKKCIILGLIIVAL